MCGKVTKVMSVEKQTALLLDAGTGKPGVRSFFAFGRVLSLFSFFLNLLMLSSSQYPGLQIFTLQPDACIGCCASGVHTLTQAHHLSPKCQTRSTRE